MHATDSLFASAVAGHRANNAFLSALVVAVLVIPAKGLAQEPLPLPPSALASSATATSVSLGWSPSQYAQYYNVYRGTAPGQESNQPYAAGIGNSFRPSFADSSVTQGTTYYYKIAAGNAEGQGGLSAEVSATPGVAPPPAPQLIKATEATGSISIFWSPVVGASSYDLYRSTASGNEVVFVTGLTAATYTDKSVVNGLPYFYVVTAVSPAGDSAGSPEVSAVPFGAALPAPQFLAVQPAVGQTNLHWSPVTNATSYDVYRSTTSGGEGSVPYAMDVPTNSSAYFPDTNVVQGTVYYYKVAAVGPNGEGFQSYEVSAKAEVSAISPPAYLSAIPGNAQVSLYWAGVSGASYYNVYKSTVSGQERIYLAKLSGTSYADKAVGNGTTYFYIATAVNADGESVGSPEAYATPGASAGAAPVGLRALAPDGQQVIDLYWTPTTNANYYNVYRSTTSGGEGSVPFSSAGTNGSPVSFQDTAPVYGTRYYYKVTAVTSAGESPKSVETSAEVGLPQLAAPTLNSHALSGTSVQLQWTSLPGESSFDIYRQVGNAPYVALAMAQPGFQYTDTGLTAATQYNYAVAAVGPSGEGVVSNQVSFLGGQTILPAPTGLAATSNINGYVSVSWNTVAGANGYNIYRATTSNSTAVWAYQVYGGNNTSTNDGPHPPGTYYYKVSAYNVAEGTVSAPVAVVLKAVPLGTPTLTGQEASGEAILHWSGSEGATSYNLYRGLSSGGESLYKSGITATTTTDTGLPALTPEFYYVVGVDTYGTTSASNEVEVTPGGSPPAAPKAISVSPYNGGIEVEWSTVAGATGYEVYRGTTAGGEGSLPYAYFGNGSDYFFYDGNLTQDTSYFYRVAAVNTVGQGSLGPEGGCVYGGGLLPAVANLRAVAGTGAIQLDWQPVTGATGYDVYRSTPTSSPLEIYATSASTTPTYTDSSVSGGQTYYYEVEAYNANGSGGPSNLVFGIPGAAGLPPAPFGLVAEGNENTTSVTLYWDAVVGANSYNVYRGTTSGGESATPVFSGVSGTGLTDYGVARDTRYYYKVSAINSSGEGAMSNEASATSGIQPLPAPANLVAIPETASIKLVWDSVPSAVGYIVDRIAPGAQQVVYAFVAAPATTYTDTSVVASSTYSYQVYAFNADGYGAGSAVVSAQSIDFALMLNPNSITIQHGLTDAVAVNLSGSGGFGNQITLSLTGLPAGATAKFYPAVATVAGSNLYISTGTAATGTYTVKVTATSGSVVHTATLTLVVSAMAQARPLVEFAAPKSTNPINPPIIPGVTPGCPLRYGETLLDSIGKFSRKPEAWQVEAWKARLHQAAQPAAVMAQEHIWVGEEALAGDQDVASAAYHFAKVLSMKGVPVELANVARFDQAMTQAYHGTFNVAATSLTRLLKQKNSDGFSRRAAGYFLRHVLAVAGRQHAREAMGIPEPSHLDPDCGAAAIATCLRALGMPYSREYVLAKVRVTGEGSTLQDLMDSGKRFGVSVRPMVADDAGLVAIPKPAVAFVEHDHFICVTGANKGGVSYLCSDCGPWPGGAIHLTWKQWHALEPWLFATVTRPGTPSDRGIDVALDMPKHHGGFQLASADGIVATRWMSTLLQLAALHHISAFNWGGGTIYCGAPPMTPPPPPPGDPPDDSGDGDGCGCGGGGGDDGGGDMGGDDGGDDGGGDMGDDGGSDMGGDDGDEGDDGGDVEVIPITLGKPGGAGGVLNLSYKAPIGGNTVVKGAHAPVISPDAQASKAATKSLLGQTFDGPSGGDPVNMATGEEEYQPKPDLVVYNPNGPEVVWSRIYNSLRGPNFSYQYSDYGINWSQPYNVGVYDPSPGQVGGNNPKYVTFANGARLSLTISALPSAGVPTVAAVVQPGSPFVVNCRYTSASPYGYYQIEFRDRTVWTTMPIATGTDSYVLAKITDRNGHSLVFNYVAGASVPASVFQAPIPVISTIVDGVSGKTLLTINRAHDGTDNVTFVEDNQGRTVLYHCGTYANVNVPPAYGVFYQQVDNVSIVQNGPAPLPTDRYQYGYTQIANGEGNEEVPFLTSITVPSPTGVGTVSNSIEYGLESDGVIARTDANGNTHSYLSTDQYGNSSFPSSYTRVLITDSSNHVIGGEIVGYDNNEDETSVSDINGNPVRSISYSDPNDPFKPSAVQDGVGLTTHFTWDAYGNMTSRKSPKGTVTTRTFTYAPFPLGELTKVQVGTKSATKYTYAEPSGDVTSVTMPAPGTSASTSTVTTSYSYDAFGNLTSVVTPGDGDVTSKTTTLNYTADGSYSQQEAINEPILIKDNAGDESHYRYNLFGKASAYEDALNRAYSATFDIGGNQIALIFPQTGENGTGHAMQQWSFLYPDGPLQSVEWHDEAGNLTRTFMYTYGNEGELSGFTDGFQPEFFTYDGGYRVVKIEDGKPNATTFSYDVRNDLVQAVTAAGEKTTYSYDADFRPTKRVDARSIETDYSYVDGDGNLSDVKYPSAAALNVHIGYDAYDRSTGTSDGTGTNAYTYDDDNDLLTAVTTYAGVPAQTLTYAYFPDGSRSSVATPAGMYSYTYDAIGRMVSVKNPAGEKSTFSFYANSFPDEVILANGAKSLYVPDARDAVSKITNLVGSTTLSAFGGSAGIVRDSLGEPLSMIATATSAALAGTTSYTLDGMGQLLEEKSTRNGTYDNKFGYDVANNPDLVRGTSATFNGDDENTALVYDLAGNGEAFPGTTSKATYDVEDRMTAFGTALTAGYRYDNLRAWTQSGSTKTYFLYDGWSPIAEISSTGSVSAYNTFGAFGLMSRRQAGTSIFYQFDPFGNVAHRTGSSGAILSNSVYDSYGKGESSATLTDPFGFGGQYGYYTDRATALVLMTHRYYDPDQARFVTRDPMGTSGGINPYGYAKNNPTVSVDPQGFDSSCPVFKYNDPINNWNAGWQTGWNAAGGDSNWITGAVGGTVGAWTGLTQTPYSFTPPTPPVNTGP